MVSRTSFYYNPALQTRSFLMLGVISEKTEKIYLLVSKTLKVLEETLQKHEADVELLEAIISCLTHFVPLLDQTCQVRLSFRRQRRGRGGEENGWETRSTCWEKC